MRRFSVRVASSVAAPLLLALVVSGSARAADQKAVVEKIKANHQAATSAFGASDFDEMKSKLLEAIALANENGLSKSKVAAQTYVLMGVLQVDGFKDADAGVRFFAKALDISPAIEIPQGMGTKAVKKAWKRAEDEDVPAEKATAAEEEEALRPSSSKGQTAADKKRADAESAADKKRADAEAAAEKKRADAEARERDKQEKADARERDKQEKAEARERDKQEKADRQEKEKLEQELAQAKLTESKGQAENEKLQRDRQEKDKALSDSKGRIALLEKDKADRDKALTDAKGRIALLEKDKADRDKTLATTKDSEAKERAAKEKLDKDRQDKEKALAEAKSRIALLEKDKADRDKWLAATKDSEAKERAAKEKLEKELQETAARDKERKAKEEGERREREKAEAGPDLPGHIGEPITCTMTDEISANEDLFVHCVPQPGTGAKVLTFYYRPGGSVIYNAVVMERTKKGWYVALVPGSRIYGRLFQYYVEARDAKQSVAATNGKAGSPNIATVRSGPIAHKGKR